VKGRTLIIVILSLIIFILVWRCFRCFSPGSCCPPLSIDQANTVGTFMSLSMNPTDANSPAEVAPARIRAYKGENVTWVFRNPSNQDVTIKLLRVWDPLISTTVDIKNDVFSDLGGVVSVAKNCGFGVLRAELRKDIAIRSDRDSCASRTFYYDFLVRVQTDSVSLKCPYDPELVVEDQP
jgi:hypothetical protein